MDLKKFFQLIIFLVVAFCHSQNLRNTLNFSTVKDTKLYFSYSNSRLPVISAHRGGATNGYPENCIETFEYTLGKTLAIFEVDVRMTQDNKVVLMHDETLERTTSGKGKVKDFNLEKVKSLSLRDSEGKITPFKAPSLKEAIRWSKGKTLLNLDVKDVSIQKKVQIVKQHNAFPYVIFTVHTAEQAKAFYEIDKRSMFSAFIKTKQALQSYEAAGIPWDNILIAYVGSESKHENKELYELIHEKGVMVMVSAAPVYDRLKNVDKRAEAYRKILKDGADIIETDRPEEVAAAIQTFYPRESRKYD